MESSPGASDSAGTPTRRERNARRHRAESVWEVALEHYQSDLVEEAFDLIADGGIGETGRLLSLYRLIEAECITRRKAEVWQVNAWLSLEYIPREVVGWKEILPSRIVDGCNAVAERLGWRHEQLTRIAILAEETDADWATYPYGYCSSKEPYEKICLPSYLLEDAEDFHCAVKHEYAHVISNSLSDGHAPRWLEEAISMLAEGNVDAEITLDLRTGEAPWLSADQLERVLESRGEEEGQVPTTLRAYQQAAWIGRYLHSVGGYSNLRQMLLAHADDSIGTNLKLRLLGRERVEGAIQKVYGRSLAQVFDEALTYLLNSEPL